MRMKISFRDAPFALDPDQEWSGMLMIERMEDFGLVLSLQKADGTRLASGLVGEAEVFQLARLLMDVVRKEDSQP
jgi:hypothetical protein